MVALAPVYVILLFVKNMRINTTPEIYLEESGSFKNVRQAEFCCLIFTANQLPQNLLVIQGNLEDFKSL